LPDIIVGLALAWASYTDHKKRIIPNYCVLIVLACGIWQAYPNISAALLSAFTMFIIFSLFWFSGGLGGGDLKLMAALGCFAGVLGAMQIFLYGAIPCIIYTFTQKWRKGVLQETLKSTYLSLKWCAMGQLKTAVQFSSGDSAPLGGWMFIGYLVWQAIGFI
jgi:prepilin signal peptidase PulO-like enzyme (type II secretory pathway)